MHPVELRWPFSCPGRLCRPAAFMMIAVASMHAVVSAHSLVRSELCLREGWQGLRNSGHIS